MSDVGRAAGAVTFSALAQVAAKAAHLALNVVASLALIRYLGPAGYGDYVFVLSFAALFGLLSDLGIVKVAVRELSQSGSARGTTLGTVLALRLLLAVGSWVGAQLVVAAMGLAVDLRAAIAVISLVYAANALLSVFAVFESELAMHYEAVVVVAIEAVDTLLILWLISANAGLLALVAVPVVSAIIGSALAITIARRRFRATFRVDFRSMPRVMLEALPIGITMLFAVVYLRLDSVLLGVLARPEDVGLYGAAYKPIEYLLLASAILINTLFPLLARWRREPRLFAAVYWRGGDALLMCLLPASVLITLFAEPLVVTFYAPSFAASAVPLRILACALIFMVFSVWQGFALLSAGRQRVTVAYDAAALALNLALNLVLIPRYGAVGAAFSALVTSVFVSAVASVVARRLLGLGRGDGRLTQVLAANAALAVVALAALPFVPWLLALAIAAMSYPVWILLFRATRPAELRLLVPVRARLEPAAAGLDV